MTPPSSSDTSSSTSRPASQSAPRGNSFLLEIGTEELPLAFLLNAPGELADKARAALNEQGVEAAVVECLATPRRLALIIHGLPEDQPGRTVSVKGPPVRVACDADGNPTQAGLGFARKVGMAFSDLVRETVDGEAYLVSRCETPGRKTAEVLAELLPGLVLELSGSHFMAWGQYDIRFSRPIRWLVSLWNDKHLPVTIGPVVSGTTSQGHRLLSGGPVMISSVLGYADALGHNGAVVVDPIRRRERIVALLHEQATAVGGQVEMDEELLDTVVMLVEQPSVVAGHFEERFLEIPEAVVTTVMKAHQKYFPVRNKNGRLLPVFLTVSNGSPEAVNAIRHGNEKVLRARLEDARFFFEEDRKIPLGDRLEALAGITFQKGLGHMADKTARLETLAIAVGDALGADAAQRKKTARAARLAKADLVTAMVFEFTELQGAMGREYALLSGEEPEVAEAIYEHYLPRFMGDAVAVSAGGVAVSLADKLDTLMAVFSQEGAKLPTGSKDPLGLRRMATGIIQTVWGNRLDLNITALMREACESLVRQMSGKPTEDKAASRRVKFQSANQAVETASAFIIQRLRGLLLEQGNRYDMIDAVLDADFGEADSEVGDPLADLCGVGVRLSVLKQLANASGSPENPAFRHLYEPANRIARILGKEARAGVGVDEVNVAHFRDESEQALLGVLSAFGRRHPAFPKTETAWQAYAADLQALAEPVERFFEKVMVNDADETVRKNRYNLLNALNRFYRRLADFSRLAV